MENGTSLEGLTSKNPAVSLVGYTVLLRQCLEISLTVSVF